MDTNEVISKIEQGQYEIEYAEKCNCFGGWSVERGELVFALGNDIDWEAMSLVVDGEIIAERIRDGERHVYVDGLGWDDIPEKVWEEMRLPEVLNRGDEANGEHARKMRDTLVEWLMEGNYELDRDDERGFANEYTMILREVNEPVEITKQQAEKWADDYLYSGDAATDVFVGLRIEEDSDF